MNLEAISKNATCGQRERLENKLHKSRILMHKFDLRCRMIKDSKTSLKLLEINKNENLV